MYQYYSKVFFLVLDFINQAKLLKLCFSQIFVIIISYYTYIKCAYIVTKHDNKSNTVNLIFLPWVV